MRVNESIKCANFPCGDVNHKCYIVPNIDIRPQKVSIILISEAAPKNPCPRASRSRRVPYHRCEMRKNRI
jgi:hypothetical protein